MIWDSIGAIAELFAALGVFATLLYLALQIRKAHQIALATLYQMRSDSAREQQAQKFQSSELIKVFEKLETQEKLTATDRMLLDTQSFTLFNHFESSHYLYQTGFLDEEHWLSDLHAISVLLTEHEFARSYWEKSRGGFRQSFADAVDEFLRSTGTAVGA